MLMKPNNRCQLPAMVLSAIALLWAWLGSACAWANPADLELSQAINPPGDDQLEIAKSLPTPADPALPPGHHPSPQTTTELLCHDHADLAGQLERVNSEHPVALGLQTDGSLLEVFSSRDGQTYTVVVTRSDGWSCIVSVGENFEMLPWPAGSASFHQRIGINP
jgi:hypothetical protein